MNLNFNNIDNNFLDFLMILGIKIKMAFTGLLVILLTMLISIITSYQEVFIALGLLIGLNIFTGITKSYGDLDDKGNKKGISTAGLSKSGITIAVYLISLCSAFILERYIIQIDLSIFKMTAGYYGLIQFYSIIKNTKQNDLLIIIKDKLIDFITKPTIKDGKPESD
jgi:hypothetical protein